MTRAVDPPTAVVNLPPLGQGWVYTTVGELGAAGEQPVLTGPFGTNVGREDFVESGVPMLTIGCLTEQGISLEKALFIRESKAEELSRYRLKKGDLLFSRMASVGRAGLVPKKLEGALFNYHIMRLRLDDTQIDPRVFISYVRGASQVRDYLKAVNHGATRDGINTEQLLAMPVVLPPMNQQGQIVAKIEELFSDLDAGVAALERARANLKRYRAAVLKAAVEGRLTAEWRKAHPDVEPASKLLGRILAERRRKWEEAQLAKFAAAGKPPPKGWKDRYPEPAKPDTTNLPGLPDGWCWSALDQLVLRSEYGTSVKCGYEGTYVPVLRIPNVDNGRIDLEDLKYSLTKLDMEPEDELIPGDLLMCRTNGSIRLVGKSAVVREPFCNLTHSHRTCSGSGLLRPQRFRSGLICL